MGRPPGARNKQYTVAEREAKAAEEREREERKQAKVAAEKVVAGGDERKGNGRSEDKKKRNSRHCRRCGRPYKGAAETCHGGTTRPDLLKKNGIDPSCQWLHPDGKSKK